MNRVAIAGFGICIGLLLTSPYTQAITVSSVSQLTSAVSAANSGGDTNIIISSTGSPYNLNGTYLRLTGDNITISGSTDDRNDVVLDGNYATTEIFQITGSNVTIQNLTLKKAVYHPIHVFPESKDVTGTVIHNVYIQDPGQQAIKINQNSAKTLSVNNGTVSNSLIELTQPGREKVVEINGSCYTGGVDAHHAADWTIKDNVIRGFWCNESLSEHGVHFWSFSQNTVVERNLIVNCDRGIGFGLGSSGHVGGIIRNNMIYHDTGHTHSDVGIGLESASGARVLNNTIYHLHSYSNGIEYRFSGTNGGEIRNNLTNKRISSRNGGTATLSHNYTNAQSSFFKNPDAGDLHLSYKIQGVVDSGLSINGLSDDFDGEKRWQGGIVDIGADELVSASSGSSVVSPWMILLRD